MEKIHGLERCFPVRTTRVFMMILVMTFLPAMAGADAQSGAWLNEETVTTQYGTLAGKETNEGACWAWLGVPFAKPPVGDLRWRAPQAPDPWGHRDATEFCDVCVQYGNLLTETGPETFYGQWVGSENCLYLNVWRPKSDKVLPVYVFIHGGANFLGGTKMSIYEGSNFATGNDMVFVSIAHRLTPFGWFKHPSMETGDPLDDSGNYGTLDIIQALKWVQENIASFGGDPGNVTLAGLSSGGMNIHSLLVSPLAKGLFHRAISMSGPPYSVSKAIAQKRAELIICRLLVEDGYARNRFQAQRVIEEKGNSWIQNYLRSKPVDAFMPPDKAGPCAMPLDGELGLLAAAGIYEDGYVIPGNIMTLYKNGDYQKMPIMLGCGIDELQMIIPLAVMDPASFWNVTQEMDTNDFDFVLDDMIIPMYKPLMPLYEPINYLSKMLFQGYGVDRTARTLALYQDVFVYKFAWDEEPEPYDYLLGAGHAMDIPFVLRNFIEGKGSLPRFCWCDANKENRDALSAKMMAYYGQFAKTGNPNPGDGSLLYWTPWNSERGADKRIVFDTGDLSMSSDVIEEEEVVTVREMIEQLRIILN